MPFSVCIDMTGQRFGMLTVIRKEGLTSGRLVIWLCHCDCGKEKICNGNILRSGKKTHCGCKGIKRTRKREQDGKNIKSDSSNSKRSRKQQLCFSEKKGWSRVPEYQVWLDIHKRCFNPKRKDYHRYGGRGITMCERWQNDFWSFYSDMGPKPAKGYTIDRINNNGNYEPGNCRWATYSEQNSNRRKYGKKNK